MTATACPETTWIAAKTKRRRQLVGGDGVWACCSWLCMLLCSFVLAQRKLSELTQRNPLKKGFPQHWKRSLNKRLPMAKGLRGWQLEKELQRPKKSLEKGPRKPLPCFASGGMARSVAAPFRCWLKMPCLMVHSTKNCIRLQKQDLMVPILGTYIEILWCPSVRTWLCQSPLTSEYHVRTPSD